MCKPFFAKIKKKMFLLFGETDGRTNCKRCQNQSSVSKEETEMTNRFQNKTEMKEERILNKRTRLGFRLKCIQTIELSSFIEVTS